MPSASFESPTIGYFAGMFLSMSCGSIVLWMKVLSLRRELDAEAGRP